MSELSSPPAHQLTPALSPTQTQDAPNSTNLVLIDPNAEIVPFDYEGQIRADFERGLQEDEVELNQILQELDEVRSELIVWSYSHSRALDQDQFNKLESAAEEIKLEEENLTQTRSSVQHFLDSVKSAAFQLFGTSTGPGATQEANQS